MALEKRPNGHTNLIFQYNIVETFTLLYDQPLDKEGDYGKYFIYKAVCDGDEVASFLVGEKAKGEEFKSFHENLNKFKAGDTLEVVKSEEKAKNGRTFSLFKITKVGEKDVSAFLPKTTTANPFDNSVLTDEEKTIIDEIKEKTSSWDKEQLTNYKNPIIKQMMDNNLTEIRANYIFENILMR